MPYIPPEIIQEAKRMDLLTYLQRYEPHELVRFSNNTYTTRTHDSLKISNGKWCWWSRGIGGTTALDYLIKVKGFSFFEAVETITGNNADFSYTPPPKKAEMPKKLLLPKAHTDNDSVKQYLHNRGIDSEIIEYCISTRRIYESANYHNAVFLGFDLRGTPKYASMRGIFGSDFKQEANGSDKQYSFCLPAKQENKSVHLFESAIDAMSYATLCKLQGVEWEKLNLLSLAGIYMPKKEIEESTMPAALLRFLEEHSEVSSLILHLDNDKAGRLASKAIMTVLGKDYHVLDKPPSGGKDVNDFLCMHLRQYQRNGCGKERS